MLHLQSFAPYRKEIGYLTALTLLCFGLILFRVVYTQSVGYLFLVWNLFLAGIPWVLVMFLKLKPNLKSKKIPLITMLFTWLLFFPNAPYIFTDLFHLKYSFSSMPVWFDLTVILAFAWTGLLFGFLSLKKLEYELRNILPKNIAKFVVVMLLFLSAFGIYLGRYLRWNSWELLTQPIALMSEIGDRIIHPFDHPRTWGLTLIFGLFLNMVYWSLTQLEIKRSSI